MEDRSGLCAGEPLTVCLMEEHWTVAELREELARWEGELVAAGKAPNTVATYVGRTEIFLRWLDGTYAAR